ncbi:putative thioredoxin-domain-containing protein [Lyophyllum shimeji]|uniref:Thioredoxin n=1 Tax=Lyophyllum shimeji TaxID=47721 RepID=A0A9P3PI49_LYOSH|nr:putative thioredoxin-domain-containing protein [Lyophyllum shimeji]
MSITNVSSVSELDIILSKSTDKLSVIDFHATWCGPCHAIAPTYEALSKQYKGVNFLKCDVDVGKDVASRYAISAMPTFVFLKGAQKVDQVRGANRAALEDALRRHSASSSSGLSLEKNTVNHATGKVTNLDPQVKVFLALVGVYLLFWYLG